MPSNECTFNRWVHIKFSMAAAIERTVLILFSSIQLIYCYCIECKMLLKIHVFLFSSFFSSFVSFQIKYRVMCEFGAGNAKLFAK